MADTTINPPSSSLKLLYRVARFAWENGEQYLGFTSDHYFSPPSSHIFETCKNFICWETEWIALPAHRSAAEAASISILTSGELCSGAVAANERSESATPLSSASTVLAHTSHYANNVADDESATGPKLLTDTADSSEDVDAGSEGPKDSHGWMKHPILLHVLNTSGPSEKVVASYLALSPCAQQMLDELEHAAYMSEVEIIYMADCAVADVLARIEAALEEAGSYSWFYFYWDDRLTISALQYNEVASGTTDDYGDVINLPRNAYLQHFTYTH